MMQYTQSATNSFDPQQYAQQIPQQQQFSPSTAQQVPQQYLQHIPQQMSQFPPQIPQIPPGHGYQSPYGGAPNPYGISPNNPAQFNFSNHYPSFPPQYPENHPQSKQMGKSNRILWLGNLHQDVDERELQEVFGKFGNIESIKLVKTKACGFITFYDPNNATEAHEKMNHFQIHNQEIKIGWGKADLPGLSLNKQQQMPVGYDGSTLQNNLPDVNRDLPQQPPTHTLWVGNITPLVTEKVLREFFEPYGHIELIRMWLSRHCAFVTYASVEAAQNAKNGLDRRRIFDTIIRVNFGKE